MAFAPTVAATSTPTFEMAQLTAAFFQTILAIEGGYQNHPGDSGNYCNSQLVGTKYGMSAVAVSTWWGRCPSEQEMRNLSQGDAQAFYAWYFDLYNLYQIQDQKLFELVANNTMGSPTNAAKVTQRALNKFGYQVAVDGAYGTQTIGALNDAWKKHGVNLYNTIRQDWVQYLKDLNRPEFIEGWLFRMNRYFPVIGSNSVGIGLFVALAFVGYQVFKKRA